MLVFALMLLIALVIGAVVLTVTDKPLLLGRAPRAGGAQPAARHTRRRSPACPSGSCASAT